MRLLAPYTHLPIYRLEVRSCRPTNLTNPHADSSIKLLVSTPASPLEPTSSTSHHEPPSKDNQSTKMVSPKST